MFRAFSQWEEHKVGRFIHRKVVHILVRSQLAGLSSFCPCSGPWRAHLQRFPDIEAPAY